MLLLDTQLVLGDVTEEKTMSLVCDGITESEFYGEKPTQKPETLSFVFEDGSLTTTNNRPYNKPTSCTWSKYSIYCHGDVSILKDNVYQIRVDRVSGKVTYSDTLGKLMSTFKGDCKKGSQKF